MTFEGLFNNCAFDVLFWPALLQDKTIYYGELIMNFNLSTKPQQTIFPIEVIVAWPTDTKLFKQFFFVVVVLGLTSIVLPIQSSSGQDNSKNSQRDNYKCVGWITKFREFIVAKFKVVCNHWFTGGPKTYSYRVTGVVGVTLMVSA